MAPNPTIMTTVEQLGYRVTVGDVAAKAGLNINFAQQGLLVLASEAGGHLQVAESGEIAYLFPKNFRAVLRNKFLRLKLQEWWEKIWRVLFYLIRISFGIILMASIALIVVAIAIILIAMTMNSNNSSSGGGGSSSSSGGGGGLWNFFWLFDFGSNRQDYYQQGSSRSSRRNKPTAQQLSAKTEMNFLESIFSFLFGDGNPNIDLEKRRWQEIGIAIRNSKGAVAAEQIAPYLDKSQEYQPESEDYMIPVLSKFDGRPEVSPNGEIVYHFPELQTTAREQEVTSVPADYLREKLWRFSHASSEQIMMSLGLGALNIVGALVLGSLLKGGIAVQLGGLVAFVNSIYWILLAYGIGFLAIPLIRYFGIQFKNQQIEARNYQRHQQAIVLKEPDIALQKKIAYAQQFAAQNVINADNLAYTSEKDLLDQELEQSDKIDAEWRKRLE